MTRRLPPLEVWLFFAAVLAYQYWLFDGLTDERLDNAWFRGRFFAAIGIAFAIAALFGGFSAVLRIVSAWFRVPLSLRWWALAIGWLPLLGLATTLTWPLLPGSPVEAPPIRPGVLLPNLGFLLIVIQNSLADEAAWIGYAYQRTQRRWVAFAACMLVGAFWGWWYQPMVNFGRSVAGTAIPVPLFIWTMMATAVVCAVLYNATRSGLIVLCAQVATNFFYLMFPILPQATNSWFPYAVFCGYLVLLVIALTAMFGWDLQPRKAEPVREIWLWPKRWRPPPEPTPAARPASER